jgi:glycosyltransferase involved in cell wall biosynthesis
MSTVALHVAQIGCFSDPRRRVPEQLLDAWPTLVDVAESVTRCGARVSVIQASEHSQCIDRNGVSYHFVPFGGPSSPLRAESACGRLIRQLAPDAFHVHGLGFPKHVLALARLTPGVPILLQDHANRLPRLWRRAAWRRCAPLVAGVAFCSRDQARPFLNAGLFSTQTAVYEIPESTSRFTPGSREAARRALHLTGDPLLLWVGHLNENKDPLTVLAGISEAARELPGLQLWCCFGTAPLLRRVRRRVQADPLLRGRVHLLGRVPHERVEQLMHAADAFVLGSHREGSGYSLIEALACGLPPVVTNIPSFRALTGAGAVGILWEPGNPRSLCAALLALRARADAGLRLGVRAHFDRELSFGALGRKLGAAYGDLADRSHAAGRACQLQGRAALWAP